MLCRLCLYENSEDNLIEIFDNNEESKIIILIMKYLHFQVTQNDSSKMICKNCLRHLNEFNEFSQLVEQRQNLLKKEFFELKNNTKDLSLDAFANETTEKFEVIFKQLDEPLFDIRNIISNELEEDSEKPQSNVEFEHARIEKAAENADDADISLQELFEKSNKRINKREKLQKVRKRKKDINNSQCKRLKRFEEKVDNDKDSRESEEKSKSTKAEQSKTACPSKEDKEKDEFISKHMELKCDLCDITVETYRDIGAHFRKKHQKKHYVRCCGTKYFRRCLLYDHVQLHLNPEYFKCDICDSVLKTRVSLDLHRANKHLDRGNMKHECKICGKHFPHLSNLNLHMFVHEKEKTHICEFCNKSFKANYILKAHIRNMHGNKMPFICESCGKKYQNKLAFERHVAIHQGNYIESNLQCPICGKWFSQNYLRRHIKFHQLEDVNCATCGKTFKSKSALTSHIDSVHKQKQNLACVYCDKTFEKPISLKEHIDMHLGRKDYKCPYCSREFRSRANMSSHVKKTHFDQWSRARLERENGAVRCISYDKKDKMEIKSV